MSDDLVRRLREYAQVAHMAAAWGFAGEGYTMEKAADRIEALEAEVVRMRDALKPFAKEAIWWSERGYHVSETPVESFEDYEPVMTAGDLFNARDVLAKSSTKEGEAHVSTRW